MTSGTSSNIIYNGDVRDIIQTIDDESVDAIITSPPYWQLRNYGNDKQIGLEPTYQEYIAELSRVFSDCRRVLKPTGTLWIIIGDKYSGSNNGAGNKDTKRKVETEYRSGVVNWDKCDIQSRCLMLIPFRLADALIQCGWILRNDIIWNKPNAMPAGGRVINKLTNSYEHILFFVKSPSNYYFDADAIKEEARCKHPSKNSRFGGSKYPDVCGSKTYSGNVYKPTGYRIKRDVWDINTQGYSGQHFACFPEKLAKLCILAGCPENGTVMDCFSGSGTTGKVANELNRKYIGIELNPNYVDLSKKRIGINEA